MAKDRLEELTLHISQMETDLDHKEPEAFSDEDAYQKWRNSASRALAHTRVESEFLERWIHQKEHPEFVNTGRNAPKRVDLSVIAGTIRQKAKNSAHVIGKKYKVQYSKNNPPTDLEEARNRSATLTSIKQDIQLAFSEIKEGWTSYPLNRADLGGVKAPLQRILTTLEKEFAIVKAFIRESNVRNSNTNSWLGVCTRALERAVSGGFILTPEEKEVLSQVQAQKFTL